MEKRQYHSNLHYTVDPTKHGSKYYPEGKTTADNHGGMCEHFAKYQRGLYKPEPNPSIAYNEGSDIEEEQANVKSRDCSVANFTADTLNEFIKTFFREVKSVKFIWVEWDEETDIITEYIMNKSEFGKLIQKFCTKIHPSKGNKAQYKGRIRGGKKLVAWLEMMVEQSTIQSGRPA